MLPLADGFETTLQIPGNHDYWSGLKIPNPVLGSLVRSRYFEKTPWSSQLVVGRHLVTFHGLCSTSGANYLQQTLAVGDFTPADLTSAASSMQLAIKHALQINKSPWNVLVIHHSPQARSTTFHGLSAQARTNLTTLCAAHKIKGILTGHRHTHVIHRSNLGIEVRCATTLQALVPPIINQDRELLVHRFTEGPNGDLEWYVTPWTFNGVAFREQPTRAQQLY